MKRAGRVSPWVLVLGGIGACSVLCCGGGLVLFLVFGSNKYGTKIPLKNDSELYYTSAVTESQARKLADYLDEKLLKEDTHASFQINKAGETYEFRVVVKEGKEQDMLVAAVYGAFAILLSKDVFEGAPVVVHLCDQNLKTLRVPDNITKKPADEKEEPGKKELDKKAQGTVPPELATLRGHTCAVQNVALNPDGTLLASAAGEPLEAGELKLWDVAARKEIITIARGSDDFVRALAFSPDGRVLASGDHNKAVKLWEVASRKERCALEHASIVTCLAWADDKTLATGDVGGVIILWDVAAGKEQARLQHGHKLESVAFSPDRKTLASAGGGWEKESEIKLWDVATRKELASLKGQTGLIHSVAFAPDGKLLASGSDGYLEKGKILAPEIKLWEMPDGKERATLVAGRQCVFAVAFSPGGTVLASAHRGQVVKLWDVATGKEIASLDYGGPVSSVAFSPDGKVLAAGNTDKTLKLWDVSKLLQEKEAR